MRKTSKSVKTPEKQEREREREREKETSDKIQEWARSSRWATGGCKERSNAVGR